jgi:hypothetical protein
MQEKHRNAKLTAQEAEASRTLAVACGIFIPRGIGAGKIGNAAEAIRRIAVAYRQEPETILALLSPLLKGADQLAASQEHEAEGITVPSA